MTYNINATIKNTDNAQALETLNYLKDNITNVNYVNITSTNKTATFAFEVSTYNEMLAKLTSLINLYDDSKTGRLTWQLSFQEVLV